MLAAVHDALTHYLTEDEKAQCLNARMVFERLIPLLEITAGRQEVHADLADLFLTGKQASALALIVNELVSNAVKHGKGPIHVSLERTGSGAILRVQDEGPGFPEGFDRAEAANTGLELVDTLAVTDLRGDVSMRNRPQGGAEVSVSMTLVDETRLCEQQGSEAGRLAA
jgi:two-component sensor histidine kinase